MIENYSLEERLQNSKEYILTALKPHVKSKDILKLMEATIDTYHQKDQFSPLIRFIWSAALDVGITGEFYLDVFNSYSFIIEEENWWLRHATYFKTLGCLHMNPEDARKMNHWNSWIISLISFKVRSYWYEYARSYLDTLTAAEALLKKNEPFIVVPSYVQRQFSFTFLPTSEIGSLAELFKGKLTYHYLIVNKNQRNIEIRKAYD